MRPSDRSLVAYGDSRTAFFHYDYLFGVVVLVERNHCSGIHDFRPHVEVCGVSVLLVDLDDELGDRTRASRPSGAANSVLAIAFLENQRYGRRSAKRAFGIWLSLVLLSTKEKDTERCSCECKYNRQAAKCHERPPGLNGFERE